MKIHWVGPFLQKRPPLTAVSRAASVWQKQQIAALSDLGEETEVHNSGYNRSWPHGRLIEQYQCQSGGRDESRKYINLPKIREKSVRSYLARDLVNTLEFEEENHSVVVYNDIHFAKKWRRSVSA